MNWVDLKRELERSLPDSGEFEWLFDDIPDRVKNYKYNLFYGVRGFFRGEVPGLHPITVQKSGAETKIYIDTETTYDLADVYQALDIAEQNTYLRASRLG